MYCYVFCIMQLPEGPSTQYLRTSVPKPIPLMVFGTKGLKYWVLGPSGAATHLLYQQQGHASEVFSQGISSRFDGPTSFGSAESCITL